MMGSILATNEPDGAILGDPGAVFELLPHPTAVVDGRGLIVLANREAIAFIGADPRGRPLLPFIHPDDRRPVMRAWRAAAATGDDLRVDFRLRHHRDGYRWVRHSSRPHTADAITLWVGTAVDIQADIADVDARERAIAVDRLRNRMLEASVDSIKVINTDGTLRLINRAGRAALGLPLDQDELGMRWLDLLPPEERGRGRRALATARQGRRARFFGTSVVDDQPPVHWDNVLTPILDDAGSASSILCVSRNVTAQLDAERRLREAGELDHLTRLLNRRCFEQRLRRLVGRARQNGSEVGLLLLDLDHFKNTNDSLGHPAGDHLLRTVARRLRRALPDGTVIGRLGGDEFGVIAPAPADPAQFAEVAHAQMSAPILYRGRPIRAGLSIGVATLPRDAADTTDLLAHADLALNDLKSDGRGGVRVFSRRMGLEVERRVRHLARARQILDTGDISAYYQPKVRLSDGALVGFEALLRWGTASGTGRLPAEIADAFDNYDLATALGTRMRERVLADIARWTADGLNPVAVSVNAAPVEFLREDFVDRFLDDLRRHDVPPTAVEIEITEPVFDQRHADFVRGSLRTLQSAGLRVILDDFGTGRSSLVDLGTFPVDGLKIHQDFIARMVHQPSIYDLVRGIVQLGSTLDLRVTAEGVETDRQVALLHAASPVLVAQGFHFGPAMPRARARALLADRLAGLRLGRPADA